MGMFNRTFMGLAVHKGPLNIRMICVLLHTRILIDDKGLNRDRIHETLTTHSIERCVSLWSGRKKLTPHDRTPYRRRHRVENVFGRLKASHHRHTNHRLPISQSFHSSSGLACSSLLRINESCEQMPMGFGANPWLAPILSCRGEDRVGHGPDRTAGSSPSALAISSLGMAIGALLPDQ